MRIALVRLSSLGDIILSMAVLQVIRRAIPESRITWITDQRFSGLLEHHPDLEQVVAVDLKSLKRHPDWSGLVEQWKRLGSVGPFEMVIDLHGMIKSAVVGALARGRQFGFGRSSRKELLAGIWYKKSFDVPYELPAMQRYLALVSKALDLPTMTLQDFLPEPYIFWTEEDYATIAPYCSDQQKNILIIPGTSAVNKNYPARRFAEVAELLETPVMVCHGSKAEYDAANEMAAFSRYVTVLPKLTIGQLKALAGSMDLVIGGDSGPTHLALATGVPSITLFGATPVCFRPGVRNRVIKTDTTPNILKPDMTDCSVSGIPAKQIAGLAVELLELPDNNPQVSL